MIMLGFAWQSGLLPLGETAIDRAIALNGEAVEMNRRAFALGRRAAAYPDEVAAMVAAALPAARREAPARTLDEMVARRVTQLTAYQDAAYAARYRALVERAAAAERTHAPGGTRLAEAVARSYFKLLAIKDEYEVARLYADGAFAASSPRVSTAPSPSPITSRRRCSAAATRRGARSRVRSVLGWRGCSRSSPGASGFAAPPSIFLVAARSAVTSVP